MFVVKFEYGVGGEAHTETCVGFDTMDKARKFAIKAVNEICERVQNRSIADNAILRVWDADVNSELIYDI